MGVPPRQPQRALSSTLPVQRPSHHQRTLSQQYISSTSTSPTRKDTQPGVEAASEPADAGQGRNHASTPRRGGSKLRLELSNDLSAGPASATGSPQAFTPSRMMPMSDTMEIDTMSPAMSRASQQDTDNLPVPMPKRRPQASQLPAATPRIPPPTTSQVKKDARPKPYTVEIPSDAPRLPSTNRPDALNSDLFSKGLFSGHADFFPWAGNHHEDKWSPEAIQKGTWDKGSQNEASSARLAVLPALKQKSGLNALSSIFMGVLNQRRHRGQVTAPSTFKPPPRVTLTDTKRELWLKDLANPTISLRRLSRTIPHGIRGRILLDQCLNKAVPTERAVWLAKCVGANEIRAFKRKGAGGALPLGGEWKWVRDWTIFVEQFIEATISSFADPDWKARVTYAIRLATNLYSEQLLERDHYLDWIMSGLENSPQSRIPMWILIAKLAWTDLLRSRKYGRRLVCALLGHLHNIQSDIDGDILIQLSSQLSNLLKTLLTTYPESFIAPSSWGRHRDTLKAAFAADDLACQSAYQNVSSRNAQLTVANTAPPAGRQYLVRLLDSSLQGHNDPELANKCWAASDNKLDTVKTVIEWGTSLHRPGAAKVYVAAKLIKSWGSFNINPTTAVLDLLCEVPQGDKLRSKAVFSLVAELVRSQIFSVSQYIQWLIGRGGLQEGADIDPDDGPCASRLLIELPLHSMSETQKAQRSSLLRRAGQYSTAEEADDIANALRCVDDSLGLSSHLGISDTQQKRVPMRKLLRMVSSSSKAVQTSIGAHLRVVFNTSLLSKLDSATALSMFSSVRLMLETVEDFSMLSHILTACSTTEDADLLAACADTLQSHLEVFLCLDSADALFNHLLDRHRAITREQGTATRSLLAALAGLAKRLPQREELAKQLQRELAQSDRSNALDACSPVSDNMAMQSQSTDGEVSEQIDKLLASGNSIDHPTMNRLFRNLIPKLESGWAKEDDSRRIFGSLLARLRIFDSQHFDKLMADWVSHSRTLKDRPPLLQLFPLLASLGCLSMTSMLQTANAGPPSMDNTLLGPDKLSPSSAVYQGELLQLLVMPLPKGAAVEQDEAYRYHIQQKVTRSEQPKALVTLIRNALIEYSMLRDKDVAQILLDDVVFQDYVLETLRYLVVADTTAVANALNVGTLPAGANGIVHKVVTKLLVPSNDGSEATSFDTILSLANELTMPFCQLKLNLDLAASRLGSGEHDEENQSQFESFAKAMDRAIEARNIMWTSMLPCLSQDITRNLSSQAHSRFLDLIPSLKSASSEDGATSEHRVHLAENLLGVIQAIIAGQPPPKAGQLPPGLVDKLTDLWEIVASRDEMHEQARQQVLGHWLPALLKFITLHSISAEAMATPNPSQTAATKVVVSPGHEARARICLVLCGLLLELDSRPETARSALVPEILDIAAILVDGLSDDLRTQCAKTILFLPGTTPSTNTTSDPRIYYLFSMPQPTWAENLRLAHRDKASLPHSAAARGMGAMYGVVQERLTPFMLRRWEILSEPTPNVGENDTSLSLGLFEAIKTQ
ncbi:RNA polymerase II mediator complex component Srb8 [Purpureocillium lavendulum]|uniref:Mediator of RNA polymerase II transcription subunit 12 n=1 Tax=Purpureocillium lavendulum TaxID=1247861 RepID=A0AB34G1F7_9HYPO|nr:RNA polymerase II mediator complex component Srb8 [Purpureocillium lavendulum]